MDNIELYVHTLLDNLESYYTVGKMLSAYFSPEGFHHQMVDETYK